MENDKDLFRQNFRSELGDLLKLEKEIIYDEKANRFPGLKEFNYNRLQFKMTALQSKYGEVLNESEKGFIKNLVESYREKTRGNKDFTDFFSLATTGVGFLEMSVRLKHGLDAYKINNLGELASKTEQELISYRNLGNKTIEEIKTLLKENGLELGLKILKK